MEQEEFVQRYENKDIDDSMEWPDIYDDEDEFWDTEEV